MVHSIELLFDGDTDAAIRSIWDDLASAGIRSQAPAGRPHVTVAVADRIADVVDGLLRPVADQLPLECAVGASLLLGRGSAILTRLIVPTAALLAVHAEVHRICGAAHLEPVAAPTSLPGHWTPHVTLARGVGDPALARALRIAGRPWLIEGRFARLRRWDGDQRVEHVIC